MLYTVRLLGGDELWKSTRTKNTETHTAIRKMQRIRCFVIETTL
jgi:hypothetical protein